MIERDDDNQQMLQSRDAGMMQMTIRGTVTLIGLHSV